MSGRKQARSNAILDSEHAGTRQLRLYTVAPTRTTNGTECSGGGYAPVTITFAAASGGQKAQNADSNFAALTGDVAAGATKVVAYAVTDTSGVQYEWFDLPTGAQFNYLSGDVVTFPAGTVVLTDG